MTAAPHRTRVLTTDLLLPLLATFALLASEGLFFYTKASFLSPYSGLQTLALWVQAASVVAASIVLPALPFIVLGHLWIPAARLLSAMLRLTAALLLAITTLLLVDNFTLTLFGFGVRDSQGLVRFLYLLLFLGVSAYWATACFRHPAWQRQIQRGCIVLALLITIPGTTLLLLGASHDASDGMDAGSSTHKGELPNILLFNGDGINARNMSVYGYRRDTTPFLKSMRGDLLVAENSFTNASDSAGSIAALLTGKEAVTTGMVYPPDVLRGQDAYQHLPGLLRQIGYQAINISMPHYADPFDMNMRGAFDISNGRSVQAAANVFQGDNLLSRIAPSAAFFLGEVSRRISQRLAHVFFLADMPNEFAEVTQKRRPSIGDGRRIAQLKTFIQQAKQPFFAHLHLMGTHGNKFRPKKPLWSLHEEQKKPWMVDYYDDAIADFDRQLQDVVRFLQQQHRFENTVLVIGSDHGMSHSAHERVPLMFRFPHAAWHGSIAANTQRIDVAPTLLDFLKLPTPNWMEGHSLLRKQSAPTPVFSTRGGKRAKNEQGVWQSVDFQPPYYSMSSVGMLVCNQFWRLDLKNGRITRRLVPEYFGNCRSPIGDSGAARSLLDEHLRQRGYPAPQAPDAVAKPRH